MRLAREGDLLRAVVEGRDAPAASTSWVREQGLAPLAFRHGRTEFRADYALASIRAEQQRELAREAVAALAAAGVAAMLLKGISYAGWLYADPAERPMSDVDLMVPDRAFDAGVAALTRLGYGHAGPAIQRSSRHHAMTLKRPGAAVDLHRSPAQRGRIVIPMDEVWARARPAPWVGTAVRPEELDEVLLHVANLARHDLIVPAMSFVDAGKMLQRLGPSGRARLARRATQWHFRRVLDACLEAVELACGWRARARWWLPRREQLLSGVAPARSVQVGRKLLLVEGPRELASYGLAVVDGWWIALKSRERE